MERSEVCPRIAYSSGSANTFIDLSPGTANTFIDLFPAANSGTANTLIDLCHSIQQY